jgi:hypothetical protein
MEKATKEDVKRKTVDLEIVLIKDWEMKPNVVINKGQKLTVSPERAEMLFKSETAELYKKLKVK